MGVLEEAELSKMKYADFRNQFICGHCGRHGKNGELSNSDAGCLIAIILLVTVVGIILLPFVWGKKKCPKCGSANIVPLDTPRGQKLLKECSDNN